MQTFKNVEVHQQIMAVKSFPDRKVVNMEVTVNFNDDMVSVYRVVFIEYKDGSVYPLIQTFNPKEAAEVYKLELLRG